MKYKPAPDGVSSVFLCPTFEGFGDNEVNFVDVVAIVESREPTLCSHIVRRYHVLWRSTAFFVSQDGFDPAIHLDLVRHEVLDACLHYELPCSLSSKNYFDWNGVRDCGADEGGPT